MHRFRPLLLPFSAIYGLILRIRHAFYDFGWIRSNRFEVPTLVVGNLALGGTGKSPVTIYLAEMLSKDYKIAILSRGYGRKTKGFILVDEHHLAEDCGDEPLQFYNRSLPSVKVAVCENRSEGIRQLMALPEAPELILLDDAMQHRKLNARNYLLLSTAKAPFFSDRLIPAGNLRDLKQRAKVADLLLWTKCESVMDEESQERASVFAPEATQFSSGLEYGSALNLFSPITPQFTRVIALAGIQDPQPFFQHLSTRWELVDKLRFPDHHSFTEKEINSIIALAKKHECPIVTTEKDAMRLLPFEAFYTKRITVLYIPIKLHFFGADQSFNKAIRELIK